MKRLLAAAAVLAASATLAPPASAQPCVAAGTVASVCYLDFGSAGRGASVAVSGTGYAFVLAGCYYPAGATYYVGVGTSATGLIHRDLPVRGVPCV